MKNKLLLAIALVAGSLGNAFAVATNYALTLTPEGSVECGEISGVNGKSDYTIQFWMNPSSWTEGAKVLSTESGWSFTLGAQGTIVYKAAGAALDIKSTDLVAGRWNQLTVVSDNGKVTALVNNKEITSATLPALPAACGSMTIGGGFDGRIDEVRVWSDVLSPDFKRFTGNTLNRWCPQLPALAAYYKFDQSDCAEIVEQTAIWASNTEGVNNHGKPSATGVTKTAVTDNPGLPYIINGAYTANERFYDRAIPAEQYQLSNDLIILGIESFSDGHLRYATPCNHASLNGATYLDAFEGRSGVVSFDGNAWLNAGKELWQLTGKDYTFETWIYIDQWVEGAAIFAKETSDGKGISLRLGEEARHAVTLTVDGHKYSSINKLETGKWQYIAVYPLAAPPSGRFTYAFLIDGVSVTPSSSLSDTEIYNVPTGNFEEDMVIGKGFKGKLDNTAFWSTAGFDSNSINAHKNNGCPMPGIGIVQTTDIIRHGEAYYEYDRADRPGYDSYSQDHWLEIMKSAYNGLAGYEVRISVKSHNGWETTIANEQRRKIFAADLARLSEGYDGVELDLEWIYNLQTNLGLLAKEIRAALPSDKSFMISCHNVAYQFPKDMMQYVDGFTFQQYGPQSVHFHYSHFENMCKTFVNYGFPKEKIIGSYATTTSKGYQNGSAITAIRGVRDGFMNGDFTPQEEVDEYFDGTYTYSYTGPLQTYNRASYIAENGLGGIFYWDMGNDVPVEHRYNLAKWASYGINSNVEPNVTKVEIIRQGALESIESMNVALAPIVRGGEVICQGAAVEVFDLTGVTVAAGKDRADISALASGVYVVRVSAGGSTATVKFVK